MKSLYEHYQALKESYYQITIDTETMFDGLEESIFEIDDVTSSTNVPN